MIDLAIVGAGSAGAAAAWAAASRGLSVVALERGPLDQAGASWLNGVPEWSFVEAGLPVPIAPVVHGDDTDAFHIIAGWGPTRVVIPTRDVLEIHMGHLVADLQARARAAGAELREGVTVLGRTTRGLRTSDGPVQARWILDAGGLAGPDLLGHGRVPRATLCTAAQQCHDLADEGAARAWVDSQGAPWGDRLCFTGISTGYSILNVRVHAGEVAILTGAHATGPRSGGQLLDDFVAAHPWIGAKRSGSRRAIPIGPPRRPLARGNVAALGDAAGQVFAAHGSGIGQQLVGARILADALAAGEGVLGYMCRWESRFGPQLDASAAFAELSRTLSPDQLARMMHAGLFVPAIVRATLEQHTPAPGPLDLLRLVRGVAREPVLARTLAVGAARVVLGR